MPRHLLAAIVSVVMVVGLVVASAVVPVGVGTAVASATEVSSVQAPPSTAVPTPHIIPEPNSGHEPIDAGDRGGALQLLLLGLIIVGVGGVGVHLVRESRRARSGRS